MASAEGVLQGHVKLWNRRIRIGEVPTWHVDPISGFAWPTDRPVRVSPTLGPPGALRRVWELNRMRWVHDLALAQRVSGRPEFLEAGWRQITGWVDANRPGMGVNWASPLEMAVRVLSWFAFMEITRSCPPEETHDRFWGCVAAQAGHTAWNLSLRPTPNNHLAGEALLILAVGVQCPWMPGAQPWARLGRDLLVWAIDFNILRDGAPAEGSTGYLSFVLEMYAAAERLLLLGELRPFPRKVRDRLDAAREILDTFSARGLGVPTIGDSDDAALFPGYMPTQCPNAPPEDACSLVATGADKQQNEVREEHDQDPASRVDYGDLSCDSFTLATRGAFTVLCAGGRLGLPPTYGHAHAHALSVLVWFQDEPLVIDPGTFSYEEQPWREYFRSTAAHSTVEVEAVSQAMPGHGFVWRAPYGCRVAQIPSGDAWELRGSHDGYQRLPQRVRHGRRVRLTESGLIIEDALYGHAPFTACLQWHLHPAWEVEVTRQNTAVITHASNVLRLCVMGPGRMAPYRGSLDPILGWYSPTFEAREPTTTLRMEARESAIRWTTTLRAVG